MRKSFIIFSILFCSLGCTSQPDFDPRIITGADQIDKYLPFLDGKKVGLCVNHTSLIGETHLMDTLISLGVEVKKVFSPEHGFKGTADAGEAISSQKTSNFELISLYGETKKPTVEHLENLDVMVFDIQDVGTRFYTYISTMHLVMEACAETNIPVIIMDRPNPNGSYIDGPVLDRAFRSFVGMHPIPIVHGLTIGELARMINGEGWLKNRVKCDLTVIPVKNWNHSKSWSLPVKPSPNLPNDLSVKLYPSLCLFEGTTISIGRGTNFPFQVAGHPEYTPKDFSFIPKSMKGAKYPKWENTKCYGVNFRDSTTVNGFTIRYLIHFYKKLEGKTKEEFFNEYFDTLAGTDRLRNQIILGENEMKIRESWQMDLEKYKTMRKKYLLYD